ncbi:MAG: hypothetical protein Q9220_000785 [cf. Caloplaca sp. 1 TL-2023]
MSNITDALPQLARLPACIYPAYEALAVAGCGDDLKCICSDSNLFVTLQGVLAKGACIPTEAQAAIVTTREICVEAVPWLNDNRGPEVAGAVATLTVLATVAVVLRFVARRVSGVSYGVDDWLMLAALRLRDANSNSYSARSKTLENGGIYAGGGSKRQQKSWFSNAVSTTGAGRSELRDGEEESQETVVPMGKIQVKHDLEWKQEDR